MVLVMYMATFWLKIQIQMTPVYNKPRHTDDSRVQHVGLLCGTQKEIPIIDGTTLLSNH